jgi:hypothetical protein
VSYDSPVVAAQAEALTSASSEHRLEDGKAGATVKCGVKRESVALTFWARISVPGKTLQIVDGTMDPNGEGRAQITLENTAELLSSTLSSPGRSCRIDARPEANKGLVAEPGRMWAEFSCPSVQAGPSNDCTAAGVFVIEDCEL